MYSEPSVSTLTGTLAAAPAKVEGKVVESGERFGEVALRKLAYHK
jgi:hypothetical protein